MMLTQFSLNAKVRFIAQSHSSDFKIMQTSCIKKVPVTALRMLVPVALSLEVNSY